MSQSEGKRKAAKIEAAKGGQKKASKVYYIHTATAAGREARRPPEGTKASRQGKPEKAGRKATKPKAGRPEARKARTHEADAKSVDG